MTLEVWALQPPSSPVLAFLPLGASLSEALKVFAVYVSMEPSQEALGARGESRPSAFFLLCLL